MTVQERSGSACVLVCAGARQQIGLFWRKRNGTGSVFSDIIHKLAGLICTILGHQEAHVEFMVWEKHFLFNIEFLFVNTQINY